MSTRGKRQCEDNWAWSNPNSIIPQSYQWGTWIFSDWSPCKVPFRIKTNYKNFYYRLLEHIFSELIRLSCSWVINFVLEMQKSSGYWKWTSIRSESAGYERKQEFDFYLSKIISNSKCWYTLITKERWSLFDLVLLIQGDHGLPKAELDEGRGAGRQRLILNSWHNLRESYYEI